MRTVYIILQVKKKTLPKLIKFLGDSLDFNKMSKKNCEFCEKPYIYPGIINLSQENMVNFEFFYIKTYFNRHPMCLIFCPQEKSPNYSMKN